VADRVDYYFRQRVTEAELDLGFELLERADRNLAADIGVYGIVSGGVPTQHAPIADLTIDLTAPGRAYDRLGQRIFFGSGQTVNLAVDSTGIPTDVSTVGQERWVGVFLRFHRLLSDPRTDGNSQQIFFRRDEAFELVVRQGPQAATGSAPKVALVDDELLLCDVRRSAGQTQVFNVDIDTSRRQSFLFAQASGVGVAAGLWKTVTKAALTVQAALDAVDALFFGHFAATANRHAAQDVDYPPHGFLTSKTVRAALDDLVDGLTSTDASGPGAAKIGIDALTGIPNALGPGTLRGHISQLLAWLNAHVGAATGAHAATAIGAAPGGFVTTTNVQSQLAEIVSDLQAAVVGQGAALIGSLALGGAPRAVAATVLRDQVEAILTHLNAHIGSGDHDGRYPRRIYSAAKVVPAATTQVFANLSTVPDLVTLNYNFVSSSNFPLTPTYYEGPYSSALLAWVNKLDPKGPALYVRNGTGVSLSITANAFLM
jgi:hypothetical protein